MRSPQVAALSKDTPVVIPIGALEQHGAHMPLFTDSLLCGEVVRRVASRLERKVLFTPMLWLGNSHHHLDFSGTLSADPRTYLDLLSGVMENLISHGFRRIVFFNGHGGNIVPGQQAVFEVRQRHRDRGDLLLLVATYWRLGAKPTELDPGIRDDRMGHACDLETSMMLRLAPHLVGDYKAALPVDFGTSFDPAARGWITREHSPKGHVGDPREATAEKGEKLFQAFADDAVRFLERVVAWDGSSWNG